MNAEASFDQVIAALEVQDEPEDHKPVSVEKSVKKVNFFRRAANAFRRAIPFV